MLRSVLASSVVVFFLVSFAYSEGVSETNTVGWDAGYVTGVEIYKNGTTGKFIRLTTSAVINFSGNSFNSEWWKGSYIQGAVYIPWDTNDDLHSAMLFSTLQNAINDISRNVKFYSVRYNSNEVTSGNGSTTYDGYAATIVFDLRIF